MLTSMSALHPLHDQASFEDRRRSDLQQNLSESLPEIMHAIADVQGTKGMQPSQVKTGELPLCLQLKSELEDDPKTGRVGTC